MKIITSNKKAFHDYAVEDNIEAGMVLTGDEVKSLRAGLVNLIGSFATLKNGEFFLLNMYIGPYSHAYKKSEDESRRTRKLLLHKKEIDRLAGSIARKGITIVPLKLYFNEKGRVKIELGLATHKKAAQRKEDLKERDIKRETRRELSGRYKF